MYSPQIYPFRYLGRYRSGGQMVHCYSFVSTKTKEKYIVHFEIFPNEFYGMKFYLKKYSSQRNRYKMLTNLGEARPVLYTCVQIAIDFYHKHPQCSLGIVGENKKDEDHNCTQRYRIYRTMIAGLQDSEVFTHVTLDDNSAYLLINNCNESKKEYIEDIVRNVISRYPNTIE